jgi:hypothetical protein
MAVVLTDRLCGALGHDRVLSSASVEHLATTAWSSL